MMPWDVEDEALLGAVRSGDEGAMKRLYETYVGFLRGVCRRYLPHDDDAVKDVLQESFIKIFTSLDRFHYRGPGSLRAWMKQICVYEALNHLRREAKYLPMEEETVTEVEASPDDPSPDVDQVPLEVLQSLIEQLPDGYRRVFVLYALDGLSHKEVARQLGISEGTSASQYARAKKRLGEMINRYLRARE